jgi:hypothetical protein
VNNKFRFFTPVELKKSKDKEGNTVMRLGGVASTMDKDADGEFLDPNGFDIEPLVNYGVVNWHHQAKNNPEAIIGEPVEVKLTKKGLYIESDLYQNSDLAKKVYKLAETFSKNSSTRRLGYSIEGKVVERDKDNPAIVKKAIITGVAVTHMPKNPKTFADIIKGNVDELEDEEDGEDFEKELNSETGSALKKESVDNKLKNLVGLQKSYVFQRIFKDITNIDIEKSKQIFSLIEKVANMKKENKDKIVHSDLVKAYESLNLSVPEDLLKKASKEIDEDDEEEGEDPYDFDKGQKPPQEAPEEEVEDTEESEEAEEEVEKGGNSQKISKSVGVQKYFDKLEKSFGEKFSALGTLIKSQNATILSLSREVSILKGDVDGMSEKQDEVIEEIQKAQGIIENFGDMPQGRKSVTRAVERFQKSHDEEEVGRNVISKSNKRAVVSILDAATFEKGFDADYSKACTTFESSGFISPEISERLRVEKGIIIK